MNERADFHACMYARHARAPVFLSMVTTSTATAEQTTGRGHETRRYSFSIHFLYMTIIQAFTARELGSLVTYNNLRREDS